MPLKKLVWYIRNVVTLTLLPLYCSATSISGHWESDDVFVMTDLHLTETPEFTAINESGEIVMVDQSAQTYFGVVPMTQAQSAVSCTSNAAYETFLRTSVLPLRFQKYAGHGDAGTYFINCTSGLGEGTWMWRGAVTLPPRYTECTTSIMPETLSWTMAANARGEPQTTQLSIVCTGTTTVTVRTNGTDAADGESDLGGGVSAVWAWGGTKPSQAVPDATGTLTVTPTAVGATPGVHSGSLVITTEYQ